MKTIKIYDTVTIIPEKLESAVSKIQDNFRAGHSLAVDVIASHAGKVTGNNGFYLPKFMREGVDSFIEPYSKPVLIHHNQREDPIGRVVAAKYVDTTTSYMQKVKNSKAQKAIKQISDCMKLDDSLWNAIDILDDEIITDPSYPGLGHILVTAVITDEDAIKKILDKRYMTVSIGASTDRAVCSICKQDWVEEGMCDHLPGKKYDGKLAFLIAGKLDYHELSFVNVPADPLAKVAAVRGINGEQVVMAERNNDSISLVDIGLQLVDNLGGLSMKNKDKNKEPEIQDAVKNKKTADGGKDKEPIKQDAAQDTLDGIEEEADKHYEKMIAFGIEQGLLGEEFKDAKLTPAKRKKLPKSTFCKPGERKYPVPDCSHARVAMAYAKKNNESSSVIACIRRKAKALGCPFKNELDEKEKSASVLDYEKMIKFSKAIGLLNEEKAMDVLSAEQLDELGDVSFCDSLGRRYPAVDATNAAMSYAYALYNDEPAYILACLKRRIQKTLGDEKAKALFDEIKEVVDNFKEVQLNEARNEGEPVIDERTGLWRVGDGRAVFMSKDEIERARKADVKDEHKGDEKDKDGDSDGCGCDELEDQLKALRQELRDVYIEYDQQQEVYNTQLAQFKDVLVRLSSKLETLGGSSPDKVEEKVNKLKGLHAKELLDYVSTLEEKVNVAKIRDKLFDGMDGKPEEKVEDPTLHLEQDIDPVSKDDPYIAYRKTYEKILETQGHSEANDYLKKLKLARLVPLTFKPTKK